VGAGTRGYRRRLLESLRLQAIEEEDVDLTADQIRTYREDGFLIVEDYIPPDRIELLRERLDRLFEGEFDSVVVPDEYVWKKGRDDPSLTRQLGNIWRSDPHIAEEAFSQQTARHVGQLQGVDSIRILQDMALVKPPNARALGVHQDGAYDTFIDPVEFTTVWTTLDDTEADAGTLVYLRGSHQWGKFPAVTFHDPEDWLADFRDLVDVPEDQIEFVPIVVKAGTCVFHSPWIWHASGNSKRADVTRRTYIRILFPGDSTHHPDIKNRFYSRYFGFEEYEFDERFFPLLWSENGYRSPWVDRYVKAMKETNPIDCYSREALPVAHLLDRTW
jgi:hypothetical protein